MPTDDMVGHGALPAGPDGGDSGHFSVETLDATLDNWSTRLQADAESYKTICDHFREMARRFAEDRDRLKHENRTLANQLAAALDAAPLKEQVPPTGKRWTEALCTKCGGNGVIKIPGGISQCPRCDGRCYEPEDRRAGAVALGITEAELTASLPPGVSYMICALCSHTKYSDRECLSCFGLGPVKASSTDPETSAKLAAFVESIDTALDTERIDRIRELFNARLRRDRDG